jgi:hypothetical protein
MTKHTPVDIDSNNETAHTRAESFDVQVERRARGGEEETPLDFRTKVTSPLQSTLDYLNHVKDDTLKRAGGPTNAEAPQTSQTPQTNHGSAHRKAKKDKQAQGTTEH